MARHHVLSAHPKAAQVLCGSLLSKPLSLNRDRTTGTVSGPSRYLQECGSKPVHIPLQRKHGTPRPDGGWLTDIWKRAGHRSWKGFILTDYSGVEHPSCVLSSRHRFLQPCLMSCEASNLPNATRPPSAQLCRRARGDARDEGLRPTLREGGVSGTAGADGTHAVNAPTHRADDSRTAALGLTKRLFQFGLYIAYESVQAKFQAVRHGHVLPRPDAKLVLLQL